MTHLVTQHNGRKQYLPNPATNFWLNALATICYCFEKMLNLILNADFFIADFKLPEILVD